MDTFNRRAFENDTRRRHRGQRVAEREETRRARRLVEGLEKLWDDEPQDQVVAQTLRELTQ